MELGPNCLDYLNGMFSFVIWDKRDRRLFAARDRLGIKPIFYNVSPDSISFSSEIKTLLASGVDNEMNLKIVNDYLRWGVLDHSNGTFFKKVFQLKAGTYATISLKNFSMEVTTYWDLYTSVKNKPPLSLDDATTEFDRLLKD